MKNILNNKLVSGVIRIQLQRRFLPTSCIPSKSTVGDVITEIEDDGPPSNFSPTVSILLTPTQTRQEINAQTVKSRVEDDGLLRKDVNLLHTNCRGLTVE